jgi:hypothetical protein
MHTSPRQMISGKLDWGWTQAISVISLSAMLTGLVLVTGMVLPLWQSQDFTLMSATMIGVIVVLAGSGAIAQVFIDDCRQNLPTSFSPKLLLTIAILWLGLLIILALNLAEVYLASFWAIVGFGLIGIALRLAARRSYPLKDQEQDLAAANHLSIITYSDQSVTVSPTSLSQQPRQFNSLMLLLFSLVTLTTIDFPFAKLVVGILAFSGLAGLYTWQLQLYPAAHLLRFNFSGIWGLAASYTVNMHNISRLEIIKLREGELHWLQLAGYSREVTLPGTIITQPPASKEESELTKTLLDTFHLARHDTNRDILGLTNVLIPLSAGMFAGLVLLVTALITLTLLPTPENAQLEMLVILAGVGMLSPAIAKLIFFWIAPNIPPPDPVDSISHFSSWEVGAAMVATVTALSSQNDGLLAVALGWLCLGAGICMLALVRRSPINSRT